MKKPTHEAIEANVLAAIFNLGSIEAAQALAYVDEVKLGPDDFSRQEHSDVFRAQVDFLRRGVDMDLFVLEASLSGSAAIKRLGGRKYLTELLMTSPAMGDGRKEQARLLKDASLRRRAIDILSAAATQLADLSCNAPETLENARHSLELLSTRTDELTSSGADMFRIGEMLDAAQDGRRELTVPTGIQELDQTIGGLQPDKLTLIGALPGVGKSSLLATIVRNIAKSGKKVGFFSLEDERTWLGQRFLSLESDVPLFTLGTRPLNKFQREAIEEASARVYDVLENVIIDDRPALTPQAIAATAREMILRFGVKAIFVDHLGEMQFDRSERYDLDVADALAVLRDLAKKYHVPVVVASHVKRRQGLSVRDEPSLTDFANSSAPERLARVALGLSRPMDGCLRVSVLKQTIGQSGISIGLKTIDTAAMVSSTQTVDVPQ